MDKKFFDRSLVITGNWKMYKTIEQTMAFIQQLVPLVSQAEGCIELAVPFTAIQAAAQVTQKTNIVIGAQNMSDASEGAFTGEISAKMLLEAGAQFVILGHSERRQLFNETNQFINRKILRAQEEGLTVTLCIGETLEERDAGQTESVLETQLAECLAGVRSTNQIRLAYEPVWAIGSFKTATPEMADEAHAFCRQYIASQWGDQAAEQLVIQYGGSVKPENAQELLNQPNVDGLLVGGSSLSPETFSQIANLGKTL